MFGQKERKRGDRGGKGAGRPIAVTMALLAEINADETPVAAIPV
jgi:hypothetical protein